MKRNLRLAAILTGATLLACQTFAEPPAPSIVNNLGESRSLIVEADQYCQPIKENRARLGGVVSNFKQTKEGTGAISPFAVTAHLYSTFRDTDGHAVLLIHYSDTRSDNCETWLEFNARGGRLAIRTPKRAVPLTDWLTLQQKELYRREMAACEAAAIPAPRHSYYGNYEVYPDGTFVEWSGDAIFFRCYSAVPNNTSAVDVNTGNGRIRVVLIGETVFLEEIPR